MVIGVSVITCCLIYTFVLMIIFFSKTRINTLENKIYSFLIVINVIGLVLELLCCYFTYMNGVSIFYDLMCAFVNRIFVIYMLTWLSAFTFYVFTITFSQYNKDKFESYKSVFSRIAILIYIILFVLAFVLPISYYSDGKYVYSYGPATNLLAIFAGVSIIFDIFCVIKNKKNFKSKQYFPLFALVLLLIIALIIRSINPGIILINSSFALITALMFHTIENPDMQLIGELYKNKKLIEKTNEDNAKFLFRVTQDIKNPVKDIVTLSSSMSGMEDREELINSSNKINSYGRQIDYLINKALNISNMDTSKIKVFDSRYNIENVFKESVFRAKEVISNDVKFDANMSSNIPTYLYGDSIKLKQIISSLINLANKATNDGFISLNIESIVRYNICRLIITVEDSGKGVSIDRVNDILSLNDSDLDKIEISNDDDRNLDVFAVKKLVNMLGGSFMLKSEEGAGTTVTVILEQKIVETSKTEISKKLESYEHSVYGEKQVLVIDDDEEELAEIEKKISGTGVMVSTSVYGRDAIEKTKSKIKYDLIILDDEMDSYSAYEVLKELKKVKDFKAPVVVMINDNKEGIRLHYLKDGFADCIMKSKLNSELERVLKRF